MSSWNVSEKFFLRIILRQTLLKLETWKALHCAPGGLQATPTSSHCHPTSISSYGPDWPVFFNYLLYPGYWAKICYQFTSHNLKNMEKYTILILGRRKHFKKWSLIENSIKVQATLINKSYKAKKNSYPCLPESKWYFLATCIHRREVYKIYSSIFHDFYIHIFLNTPRRFPFTKMPLYLKLIAWKEVKMSLKSEKLKF